LIFYFFFLFNKKISESDLFKFIRDGRVVDEYGEQIDVEEFITMALDWGKEDGWDIETY
jgi:hypothetical protein